VTANPIHVLDLIGEIRDGLAVLDPDDADSADAAAALATKADEAFGLVDDLLDALVVRADPEDGADVVNCVNNCADMDGDLQWCGQRALYSACGGLVDATSVVNVHPHLFRFDGAHIWVTDHGRALLDQWKSDCRRPWRAILAKLAGRRPVGRSVTSANGSTA
jgi:hypothetical protein